MGRLTVHEAAARVGRSVGTVRAWVRAGRLVGVDEMAIDNTGNTVV